MTLLGARFSRLLRKRIQTVSMQCGGWYDLAAEDGTKTLGVDADAALFQQISHVQRDDDRDTCFDQLSGQVKISFDVGCIDQVNDDVRILTQDIVPTDNFLKCVGRKRVDTGKVGNDCIAAAELSLHLSLFFLNCDTRPVSDILVAARQSVEHGCLPAVWVAGKCKFQCHRFLHSFRYISSRFRVDPVACSRCPRDRHYRASFTACGGWHCEHAAVTGIKYIYIKLYTTNYCTNKKRFSQPTLMMSASFLRTESSYPRTVSSTGSPSGATLRT